MLFLQCDPNKLIRACSFRVFLVIPSGFLPNGEFFRWFFAEQLWLVFNNQRFQPNR
jgi:hypothetical protein